MVLNLHQAATVDAALHQTFEAIAEDDRSVEWTRGTVAVKQFKAAVMAHGKVVQNSRCVWCELPIGDVGRRSIHRDHIAPKGLHSRWTFEPLNIALACEYCNGFAVKGDLDTVAVPGATYQTSSFRIVHPYLDTPSDHITYSTGEQVVIEGRTPRGKWTIEKLRLDNPVITKERAIELLLANLPVTDDQALLLEQALGKLDT